MPELLHPGVYVQEVPSAVRPIEGVSTSTAAFIGIADKGQIPGNVLPAGTAAQPQMVTSLTEYQRTFGTFRKDSFLTYAVRAFFDNGGRRLYIVRVADSNAKAASATIAEGLALAANSPGTWASSLQVSVGDSSDGDSTKFSLAVSAMGQSKYIQLENFDKVSPANTMAAIGASKYIHGTASPPAGSRPANSSAISLGGGADGTGVQPASGTTPGANGVLVNARQPGSWANNNLKVAVQAATNGQANYFDLSVQLQGQAGFQEVEHFTNLTFRSGATRSARDATTLVNQNSSYITLPNVVAADPAVGDVTLSGGTDGAGGTAAAGPTSLSVSAANEGLWGNGIGVQIADSSDRDPHNFKVVVWYGGTAIETFDHVTYQNSPTSASGATYFADYAREIINRRSSYIAITKDFASRPANTPVGPGTVPQPLPVALAGGKDSGDTSSSALFIGAPAQPPSAGGTVVTGTGLYALDKVTDVNLIAIPGMGDPDVVNAGMEYCKNRPLQDCFFIADIGELDPPSARLDDAAPDAYTLQDARNYATLGFNGISLDRSAGDYGALYYPWVWAADPLGTGLNPRILLPPSGYLAGIYARIDNSRGVFKAPAGTEAGVFGALAPLINVSDTDQDELNPISVNVIRTVPGSGIVVWGTRTIGSDSSWRYIPVRRVAIFLRVSIYNGIQWAVFEPNDEPLWATLRLNIRAFMLTQFRAGAFQGAKPDDAFFVKCDSTTTTQQDIDNGVVNILVGFAPLKPAEFVVLKLSQKVNQPAQ